MNSNERITQLIYDAIGQINADRPDEQVIEKAPTTVLLGDSAKLDSLAVVSLVATLEENLTKTYQKEFSLIELLLDGQSTRCTVATMAQRIADLVDG